MLRTLAAETQNRAAENVTITSRIERHGKTWYSINGSPFRPKGVSMGVLEDEYRKTPNQAAALIRNASPAG